MEVEDISSWFVLVCGLPLAEDSFWLGPSITIRKLVRPLSVFDLAEVGAVGFREWATLEPLAPVATAEIESHQSNDAPPGYDSLNRAWLVSGLLILRGFVRHMCPAVSAYSWNLIAGHQLASSPAFKKQLVEEGIEKAVYEPRNSLPKFRGGLLDYHLKVLLPTITSKQFFDQTEADWVAAHIETFNQLAANDERFRFALEAAVDWRFAKDARAAIARLWAGIESLFNVNTELVFRISLMASTVIAPRGPNRLSTFRRIRNLYGLRSKAVHGEPVSEEVLLNAMTQSFDLLRQLLIDAVTRGAVRKEDDFYREIFC